MSVYPMQQGTADKRNLDRAWSHRLTAKAAGGRLYALSFVCVLFTILSGCADQNGSMTIDSGAPLESIRGRQASKEPVYAVHVGERARLTFTWKFDACDYAILLDESTGEYFDCGPPLGSFFEWDHTFGETKDENATYRLIAEGYLAVGHRDRLPVRGELREHHLSTDAQDSLVARAIVHVKVYQSELVIDVPKQGFEPVWELTKLVLTRDSGKETILRRQAGGHRGFRVEQVGEPTAEWRIRYEPAATEINHAGRTKARLILADDTGRTHNLDQTFDTP